MNQRIENELNSILEELENLGHCKNDLISHCLKQDGIQIARRWDIRRVVILGMLIVGMSYLFFLMNSSFGSDPVITVERDLPAFIGKDNTLCYPAQVQIKNGKFLERWHWDFGQYGDLNGFIQRYACNTDVDPLSVTCYRQGEKFKKYDPNIKPLPKSIVWSWVANSSIRYGVVDEQSRNHGLWIEFLNNEPTSAELWNHGFQVGLAKRDIAGQWSTTVKVAGFEMPSDPVAVWHETNQGYFNPDYAKTLIGVKHSMIRHDLALAKLVSPSVLSNIESDEIRFAQKGN